MATRLGKNSIPMDYHSALRVLRDVIKERPDAILVNEGANTLDQARGVIDMYQPRKRLDVGTWGDGHGWALPSRRDDRDRKASTAIEGDSASASRHGGGDDLPLRPAGLRRRVQRGGIYRGDGVNLAAAPTQPTAFVRGARYVSDRSFGGVGVSATTPDELKRAVDAAMDPGKPTLINAVIDPAAGSEVATSATNPKSALTKKAGA
jgi:oxalyl-CoA decarboxylase